jgi:hypothetical protein
MVAVLAALVGALVAAPVAVYASHQFTDVPNTNPFHDDIAWLADAEVTLGCGGGQYCPDDFVTREQMAAFMRRLAENQVVDAATVEGMDADDLLTGEGGSQVLAGSVSGDASTTTGDISDVDWDGLAYTVTFDGEDLEECSGVAVPGYNDSTGASFDLSFPVVAVGAVASDEVEVVFVPNRTTPLLTTQTSFNIVIACP